MVDVVILVSWRLRLRPVRRVSEGILRLSAEWPWINPQQLSGWLAVALLLGPHTSAEYLKKKI